MAIRDLGDYIREQRQASSISLRQLARLANVSNPYLSQIERGLRKPSAEILQQIAKALRISAEAMYVQAGILDERETDTDVPGAVLRDEWITERQKQVLLEIYDSFRKENDGQRQSPEVEEPAGQVAEQVGGPAAEPVKAAAKPRKKAAPKAPPAEPKPDNPETTVTNEATG